MNTLIDFLNPFSHIGWNILFWCVMLFFFYQTISSILKIKKYKKEIKKCDVRLAELDKEMEKSKSKIKSLLNETTQNNAQNVPK